VVPPMRSLRR